MNSSIILFDILHSPEVVLSLPEIIDKMDKYLSGFENPMMFDESTIRKKLKEYTQQRIIVSEKDGRRMLYRQLMASLFPILQMCLIFTPKLLLAVL